MAFFDEPEQLAASAVALRRYNASIQERDDSDPDPDDRRDDKVPVSDEDAQRALDNSRHGWVFEGSGEEARERASTFTVPGEWVSPVVVQRQRDKFVLPSVGVTNDLSQRVRAVMRFDNAPAEVAEAAQAARLAIGAAIEAHEGARNPENMRFARTVELKDEVIVLNGRATASVAALESIASQEDVQNLWFDSLTRNIEVDRKAAAKHLDAAVTAYSAWRQSIAAADALAQQQSRWSDWHHDAAEIERRLSPTPRPSPLELIGALREARDIANDESDFTSGRYLTTDYGDEIPPHTKAYLERQLEAAPGGSFIAFNNQRLLGRRGSVARQAIAMKDLRIAAVSPIDLGDE